MLNTILNTTLLKYCHRLKANEAKINHANNKKKIMKKLKGSLFNEKCIIKKLNLQKIIG